MALSISWTTTQGVLWFTTSSWSSSGDEIELPQIPWFQLLYDFTATTSRNRLPFPLHCHFTLPRLERNRFALKVPRIINVCHLPPNNMRYLPFTRSFIQSWLRPNWIIHFHWSGSISDVFLFSKISHLGNICRRSIYCKYTSFDEWRVRFQE